MNKEYTYLLVNFFTILFPLLFSFYPGIRFYRYWKFLFPAMAVTALFFIVWDGIFTALGVWHFNNEYITGLRIVNLPLEEIMFFFAIPYACVFLYETLSWKVKPEQLTVFGNLAFFLTAGFLIVSIILNSTRLYTLVCFALLTPYLFYLRFVIKFRMLNVAFLAYSILLVPFFLVNGYLTGMFTPEPVVLYNDAENMGIRMITIPVEDTFYGLFLFLMNVHLYELFKKPLNQH